MGRYDKPIIIVHGGAGAWRTKGSEIIKEAARILKDSVIEGFSALQTGSAIEAVTIAVKILEDSGIFNAGIGSALNMLGEVEMDAGIMDGKTLRAAGVGAVKRVRNPIVLARKVLELTDHVLLVGDGAEIFAHSLNLPVREGVPPRIVQKYHELLRSIHSGKNPTKWRNLHRIMKMLNLYDTVGAIAIDSSGNVAASASTGGIWFKMPGRIGDSSIVGAGFYADNKAGAASASGIGEIIMLMMVCKRVIDFIYQGLSVVEATKRVVENITKVKGIDNVGVIALDIYGNASVAFNTEGMARAVMAKNLKEPRIAFFNEAIP
ncbi:MAG: asparaginase [Thermoprotei archaeon]|mgnify:CR=1 FL=1|nr:MAG: asparaginase [Thermoprotei archaeon]